MASKAHVVNEIEALENHFMRPVRQPDQQERWMRDYIEDLKEFPDETVTTACKRWRQSGAPRFPTSGQLRTICVQIAPVGGGDKVEPWRPVSDEEYSRMTLREKIRHHSILAHEARGKAGPMWKSGRHMMPEDMPATWRNWRERASNHDAEVMRLRAFLKTEEQRA